VAREKGGHLVSKSAAVVRERGFQVTVSLIPHRAAEKAGSEPLRRAIVVGTAVVLALMAAVGPADANTPPPGGAAFQTMTLSSSTAVPTVGTSVLTIQFDEGRTPAGNFFDIWACPDTTVAPVSGGIEGGCRPILFWIREATSNVESTPANRALKANELTMSWLIDFVDRPAYFVYDTDEYLDPDNGSPRVVGGLADDLEDVCVLEGTYIIVHDFLDPSGPHGLHSNFIGPLQVPGCTPALVSAPHPMELVCTPDPVVPGGTVTCVITQGDPSVDILWRASFGGSAFVERGVTLDADGRGTFTFVAPRTAQGQVISVELVEWLPAATVQVTEQVLPTRLPAGEGSGALPLGLALGALVLTGAAALRLRRAGAVS
jgi:hypothetical protein